MTIMVKLPEKKENISPLVIEILTDKQTNVNLLYLAGKVIFCYAQKLKFSLTL